MPARYRRCPFGCCSRAYTTVEIGSYWASNFIWHLGRVVKVLTINDDMVTCEIVRDEDDTVTRVNCNAGLVTGKVGKVIEIRGDNFRPFTRPIHRGLLPAKGPDDYRTSILTHEEVHPIKHRGLKAGPLLKLKWENGWTVRIDGTDDVVDYEPRRKGDAQPWRMPDGKRYRAGQCVADFPEGMRTWWGTTTETYATTFPTSDWFTMGHLLVGENAGYAACGLSVWRVVHPEDVHGLEGDFSARTTMCENCEADQPAIVMGNRVATRLGEWTGEPTGLPTGSFDLKELDEL
jgi:hypothetical protein